MCSLVLALVFAASAAKAPPVLVSIKADPAVFSPYDPVIATIVIENRQSVPLSLDGEGELHLNDASGADYFAPFSLSSQEAVGPNVELPRLSIKPFGRLLIQADLFRLRWNKAIYSVWPNEPLDIVPTGAYTLSLVLSTGPRKKPVRLEAPSVPVTLKGGRAADPPAVR